MELRIKLKPKYSWVIQNKNSFYLGSKLRGSYFKTSDGTYCSWGHGSDDQIFALVFEKHRKKIQITNKRNKGIGTGKAGNSFARKVISSAHWNVKCYVFNKTFLKDAGLKIIQHPRSFEIVSVK